MNDVRELRFRAAHGTTPAAVTINKDMKRSLLKSNENTQGKEGGPNRCVSNDQFSPVTPNELATKAREGIL